MKLSASLFVASVITTCSTSFAQDGDWISNWSTSRTLERAFDVDPEDGRSMMRLTLGTIYWIFIGNILLIQYILQIIITIQYILQYSKSVQYILQYIYCIYCLQYCLNRSI